MPPIESPERDQLIALRERAGVSQIEMAKAMGIPQPTYQALVYGLTRVKPIHYEMAKLALIKIAIAKADGSIMTPELKDLILAAYQLIS